MADAGKRLLDVTVQSSIANSDQIVIIYNAANSTIAQTALIALSTLFANISSNNFVANTVIITGSQTPANSTALTITKGAQFSDNTYAYYATANNHIKRVALSDF